MKIEPCYYCKKPPTVIKRWDREYGHTVEIRCDECKNYSGEHIGTDPEGSSADWWNDQQEHFAEYAVPMDKTLKE